MSAPIDIRETMRLYLHMSKEETVALREQFIPKSCSLHFEKDPLKLIRAKGQYLYSDQGVEYLDCVNSVAHVGHCHPSVVNAGQKAMLQMGNIAIGMNEPSIQYVNKLKTTFPSEMDTFLFVTSGSEANDLAIHLSRLHSGGYDVVAVERSFHGHLSVTNDISTRQFRNHNGTVQNGSFPVPDWVHIVSCPDIYHGKYRETDMRAVKKYCNEVKFIMKKAVENNRKLACFICEPIMTIAGMIIPPSEWMHSAYKDIRSFGGLAIADEAQTGLGRCGTSLWSYQTHDNLVPDIITIGKPLGNGHPMAVVVTRSSIAARLGGENLDYFQCDAVASAIGSAVLNTVRNESLQHNARNVGTFLREGLRSLAAQHANIGDVRGCGLMVGVEIVFNRQSRKPASALAERICYLLKDKYIIVANEGVHKNVLLMMPPLCFTCENAHRVIVAVDKILKQLVADKDEILQDGGNGSQMSPYENDRLITLANLEGFEEDSKVEESAEQRATSSSYCRYFDFEAMD